MADGDPGLGGPTFLDLYRAHIEYIRHENELLHQRVTWLLAVQGGALAAMSLSMQKYFEALQRYSWGADLKTSSAAIATQIVTWGQFAFYWFFIAAIGFGGAVLAIGPLKAARNAQSAITRAWNARFRDRALTLGFPEMMGGGLASAEREGGDFAVKLPWIFAVAWVVVIVVVLASSYPFTQQAAWSLAARRLDMFPLAPHR